MVIPIHAFQGETRSNRNGGGRHGDVVYVFCGGKVRSHIWGVYLLRINLQFGEWVEVT